MAKLLGKILGDPQGLSADTVIPAEDFGKITTDRLKTLLLQQPQIDIRAQSVYDGGKSEDFLSRICSIPLSKLDKGVAALCNGIGERFGTVERYVKIHGVEAFSPLKVSQDLREPFLMPIVTTQRLPPWGNEKSEPIATFKIEEGGAKSHREGLFIFYSGKREIKTFTDYADWPTPFNFLGFYRPCLNYIKKYDADFEKAAKLLHSSHPDLHIDNVRIWIRQHFIHELRNLDSIDIWQDSAACREIDCEFSDEIGKAFPEIHTSNRLFIAWKMATSMRGNLTKQGFGPGQIILELAIESGEDEEVARKYRGIIPDQAFLNQKEMLRAILHPVHSIYLKAMTYDYLLKKMKKSIFRSTEVRFASDRYPFLSIDSTAREMALINGAQILSMYPEEDHNLKDHIYSGPNLQMFNNLCVYSKMLDIEPRFPGVICQESTHDSLSYTSKFSGTQEMDGTIKKDIPWYLYTIRPELRLRDVIESFKEFFRDAAEIFS
ncbi:MAG: hypothetical protein BWY40_00426 [bacterium ADurb.Bin270]|nr:MAG: hypothetical protein BWY40_00426 [bacterium ADurb.Bin270]